MKLGGLRKALVNKGYGRVEARELRGSVILEGRVSSWEGRMEAGHLAARGEWRGVVNDLEVEGLAPDLPPRAELRDSTLEGAAFDVAIVGGGVIGCAIARELSKWDISTILLEKEIDVATHASSRNDGMIHDGMANKPKTRKAAYNVRGNRMWEPLARELGVFFARPGSLVLFSTPASATLYPVLASRASENGVDGWERWSRRRVLAEEPNVTESQHGGIFLPSAGILSPYRATVALAESAAMNGVRFALSTQAEGFDLEGDRIARVRTNRGSFRVRAVVNAAGIWADYVAAFADDRFFSLYPRRGTDLILDAVTGSLQNHILTKPTLLSGHKYTKGGGLIKTIEGNLLAGPTAAELPGREDYSTHPREIRELEKHIRLNRRVSISQVITYFAGVRACSYDEDFILERSARPRNLVHVAGIQSPGLASAPALAADASELVLAALREVRGVRPAGHFVAERPAPLEVRRLPFAERAQALARNPLYGHVVCRCEGVSEGEVRDALRSPLAVVGLDAVKRRTRAGMGRCHGGFCTPRVLEILADEAGIPLGDVTKKGPGSWVLARETKTPEGGA